MNGAIASNGGFDLGRVALLLGAQTAGALVSNVLWGWWGDRRGKGDLLRAIAFGRILPPLAILVPGSLSLGGTPMLLAYGAVFFVLGALANGLTIAVIGFLMEISPDDQRPAYSGYFNAVTAPAFLLPLLAGMLASVAGLTVVFILSALAAATQFVLVSRLEREVRAA